MIVRKTPGGTYGARLPAPPGWLAQFLSRVMIKLHRRKGDRFQDMDLLYLTTTGAKSGAKRQTPVTYVRDGDAWLIVASWAGAAHHPAWYHNIAAHPDQVVIEVGGTEFRVEPEQLEGEARAQAWHRLTEAVPRFATYETKTDRMMPVLRLTRAT